MIQPMHARSVEYLLNEAALNLAEVEARVWDGHDLPVPIDAIAEQHFGLLIREVAGIVDELPEPRPEGEDVLSAALIPERAEIWIDATEASREPRRRRESIAHELGHWVLHRGPDRTLCRDAVVDPVDVITLEENAAPEPWRARVGRTGPAIEWEANVFGGALLLPPWLVQEAWERNPELEALAEQFEVSLPTADGAWQRHYRFVDTSS